MADLEVYLRARYPLIYLVSYEERRMTDKVVAITEELKRKVFTWSVASGLRNLALPGKEQGSRDPAQVLSELSAAKDEEAVVVLYDFHPYLRDPLVVRRLRELAQLLRESRRTLVLLSGVLELPDELQKEIVVVDAELPARDELQGVLAAWIRQLERRGRVAVELDPLARSRLVEAARGLTLTEFEDALAKVLVTRGRLDDRAVSVIVEEKRQIVRKSEILEFQPPVPGGFASVGGLRELKSWLRRRADGFSDRAREFGLPYPKGLLLVGVQGCGKSLAAKAVAHEWNLPLLRFDVGKVFAPTVGSSERNVRLALRLAESVAPCVLWIDEIEKGWAGASSSSYLDAGVSARVLASFLTWLQEKEKPVFVVATSNDLTQLPPEAIRRGRFDEIFAVGLPSFEERQEIFRIHLAARRRDPDSFDLPSLASRSDGYSGAEIEQAVTGGLVAAFSMDRALTTWDVLEALSKMVPLRTTMAHEIERLTDWARRYARSASE
ncbi:MAG: AAA family ATPase [Acidobacteriota bacterium]